MEGEGQHPQATGLKLNPPQRKKGKAVLGWEVLLSSSVLSTNLQWPLSMRGKRQQTGDIQSLHTSQEAS